MRDDTQLFSNRRDISGGVNNRMNGNIIGENQSTVLLNADIATPGESTKRPGTTVLDAPDDSKRGYGMIGFEPDGGTNHLVWVAGVTLDAITDLSKTDGTAARIASGGLPDTGLTDGHQTAFVNAYVTTLSQSVLLISNGTDNVHELLQDYTLNDLGTGDANDVPLTTAMTFYRGILFALKNGKLHFSSAYPSNTFENSMSATTFSVNCGAERFVIGVRDLGLIIAGKDSIWGLNPSMTPVATDKLEKILDLGCAAGKTAVMAGDDIIFLAYDGVRGLFRTVQDKLQATQAQPLSFLLKDEVESLNWAHVNSATNQACGVWFDNKYFIAVPVDSSAFNNEVWIYYPSQQAWVVVTGWNVGSWATINYNGAERLYYIDSTTDRVHRAWTAYNDSLRTFTASQATTVITATVGTFEAGDVGKIIVWANGSESIISAYTDSTHVVSTTSETKASQACYIGYINYQEEGRKEDMGEPLKKKSGGEVKIKALSSGDYDIAVSASIDDGGDTSLGTLNLTSSAPTLPATLPFTLAAPTVTEEQFHLDSLGEWHTIRLKLRHNDTNGSDDIKIYERQIVTFPQEYYSE